VLHHLLFFTASSGGTSPLVTLYYLSGVTALVVFLAIVLRLIYKAYRHVDLVHEAIIGRPAAQGIEARPGMVERFDRIKTHLDEQDAKIESIDTELRPNGGASVFDKIDRLEKAAEAAAKVADVATLASETATAAAADAAKALAATAATAAEAKAVVDAEAARVAAKVVADAAATAAERAVEALLAQRRAGDTKHKR
jgi:hypothetical protein